MYNSVGYTGDIEQAVIHAISSHRVVQVKLASGWRTLEPYQVTYSQGREDTILLYGYCRDTISSATSPSRWQYFQLSDVKRIELTNYFFDPLVEYYEQDSDYNQIVLMAIGERSEKMHGY